MGEAVSNPVATRGVVLREPGETGLPVSLWRATKSWRGRRGETPWFNRSPADLVRQHSVMRMRAIRPESGIRPNRAGDPVVALVSELTFPEQIGNYHRWLRLLLRKAGRAPVAAFEPREAVHEVPAVPRGPPAHYPDSGAKREPRPNEKFALEDVRKDEACAAKV